MTSRRWTDVERIFGEARERPARARAAFVAGACGTDEGLRAEVLSLLDADAASDEFLAEPALHRLAQTIGAEGWSLRSGEAIGPYTIRELLGAGGAGEVWRATDERLGRDVAIKVLLPHFADHADRLRRFADEARAAGGLNHSNILTVYDVGEHRGIPYIASECLEGLSLRQRLDAGPIAAREAIRIVLAIARGLSAAHARSMVHRDLKPENTFLRSDGGVKILDFGLAKLQSSFEEVAVGGDGTVTGVIVGTAGYMAPEQVKGEPVDARTDLFALGVMLYEMLAGQHPFRRGSTFETLQAILTTHPADLSTAQPAVPPALSRIVMRLIEKAPDARFQSALDVIWNLEQAEAGSSTTPQPITAPSSTPSMGARRGVRIPVLLGLVLIILLGLLAAWPRSERQPGNAVESELTRFTWPLPPDVTLGSAPIVSPDGRRVAFVGQSGRASQMYIRERGRAEAEPIPGTEGATHPFWSPDGGSIGFFARGRLMTVAWQGGAPSSLAAAPAPVGGSWGRSGTILFGPDLIFSTLRRLDPGAKAVEDGTQLESPLGDNSHRWPVFLPDGVHFLYYVRSADDQRRGIHLGRIDEGTTTPGSLLLRSDSNAVYVPLPGTAEGLLLSVSDGRIEARGFDVRTMSLTGEPRTLGMSAGGVTLRHPAMLSATADVLAFAASHIPDGNRLEAVDRQGRRVKVWDQPEAQNWPRISPDGRFLARQRIDALGLTIDLWVEDLERGPQMRVTTAPEPEIRPVWSPDGRYLAFASSRALRTPGATSLGIAAADGTGVVQTLPCPGDRCEPTDWTPLGLLVNVAVERRSDVWIVPTGNGVAARPLLTSAFNERDARLSRDARWVAYVSEESGRPEVSIRSVSGAPRRIPVSSEGGDHPVWRSDGLELFFIDLEDRLRAVPVRWNGGVPSLGRPDRLGGVPPIGRAHWGTPYDVSPDGSRVYFLRRNDDPPPREIHVVLGWRALLKGS